MFKVTISLFFILWANLAAAASMNNDDLIKLIKSGLNESLILQSIEAAESKFDTSADGLIQLKRAGATDVVIRHVLQKRELSAGAISLQANPNGACVFRASYNHIGIEDEGRFLDVGFQQASLESNINSGTAVLSLFTLGLTPVSGKAYAVIDGARADIRVRGARPTFIDLNADRGLNPGDLVKLVRLDITNGKRNVSIGEASESLLTSDEKIAFPPEKLLPLQFEMTVKECVLEGKTMSIYRAVPLQPLPPGEYAIAYGTESYYSFGID